MRKIFQACGVLAAAMSISAIAEAADPSELGKSLTPFGAIKAGNADGSIPAWDGGITKPPAGYKPGQHYVDPYGGDKPLFTITAENADKYKDKLGEGTLAKLKAYPTFKVVVYPSHRSFSSPQYIYDAAIENAKKAHLSQDGQTAEDNTTTIPFPLAANGAEVMLNHIMRWRGTQEKSHTMTTAVTESGEYTEQKIDLKIIFPYDAPGERNKINDYFYAETVAPARTAGDITLVHEFIDPIVEPRLAWTYNPGQRRVRRAPEVEYDNPISTYDSLATTDDFDMFNGALDRYDWKLVGKKEMYVPLQRLLVAGSEISIRRPSQAAAPQCRYPALGIASRLCGRGDAEGFGAACLCQARILCRRGQLVRADGRSLRRSQSAVADRYELHDQLLRRADHRVGRGGV